jgi:hypothetical protein
MESMSLLSILIEMKSMTKLWEGQTLKNLFFFFSSKLSSLLLSKMLNIWIYGTIILTVVLCRCDTQCLTSREEHNLQAIFEVLTAVVVKCYIYSDMTPYSPSKVDTCFGGTYRLHL